MEVNKFYEGQKVVCISENFPVHTTTEADKSKIGTQAPIHPKKGETLVIDEMLGDFLRFDKYDTDAFNWWHCSRFRPLDEIKITSQKDDMNKNYEHRTDCEDFEPKEFENQCGNCETDGHYLCGGCKHIAPFEQLSEWDIKRSFYPKEAKAEMESERLRELEM